MTDDARALLIKRYASRRLYNTETSDYVTLEDIARFIRDGREVKVVDLKSGDDLTRQYLLQIIAEHESRGESVLPIAVLTDLVRSYTNRANSVMPQFLAMSFDMLRDNQSKMMENFSTLPTPINPMSGFEAIQRQQRAFLSQLVPGWGAEDDADSAVRDAPQGSQASGPAAEDELKDIKQQLDELKKQMARLNGE